jgi:hypothetical protein
VPHVVRSGLPTLLARISSVSYISALEDGERAHVLREVHDIVAADPMTRGHAEIDMPYLTHLWWCHALA